MVELRISVTAAGHEPLTLGYCEASCISAAMFALHMVMEGIEDLAYSAIMRIRYDNDYKADHQSDSDLITVDCHIKGGVSHADMDAVATFIETVLIAASEAIGYAD